MNMIYLKKVISLSSSSITFSQDASVQSSSIKNSSELLLHPRPNELQFSFPVYEGAQAVIPSLFISRTQLYGNDIFNVRFPMKTIMGDHVEVNMLLPPSEINPDIPMNSIEDQALFLAEERGIYEGHKFRDLSDAFFAGLVGVVYPSFDTSRGLRATVHIDNLFAVDDLYDSGIPILLDVVRQNFASKIEIINDINKLDTEAAQTVYLDNLKHSDRYSNLSYAYAEEFIKQKEILQMFDMNTVQFLQTLNQYFYSVVEEKSFEEDNVKPTESQNTEIRADASGAVHAITMGASFSGIDIDKLEKKYYSLKNMKTYTARCVEFSNDVYSLYKEHQVLKNKYESSSFGVKTDILEKIKKTIAFNIVQILWQNKKNSSLTESVNEAVVKHNDSINSYFQAKSRLIRDILFSKNSLEEALKTDPDNVNKIQSLALLNQDFEQIKTYCKIMEGWLAHGWWALSVPRYNLGVTPCSQERLLELQTLQKELLHVDDTGH